MDTRNVIAKGWPVRWALKLGRFFPAWGAQSIARLGAWLIMILKPDTYRAARVNLRHVLGAQTSSRELNRVLYQLFVNTLRRYYEFFYNLSRERTQADHFTPPTYVTEATKTHIQQAVDAGRGLFVLATHTSNFDFGGIALSQYMPVPLQVLSLADPTADMEIFNELRVKCGVMMTPITANTLRDAMERLRKGGAVATGPDHPIGADDKAVEFFGATAYLPTGYIRIPMRTHSPVMIIAIHYEDSAYWVSGSRLIEMVDTGNRKQDEAVNLYRVLSQVEDVIRLHPEEWMMFVPVWKEDGK